MINGFLPFLHIGVAFNKSFIFPQLKNTSENECNFSAEERTRKNEHGFSFLEAVKVHMTRISIFLQAKNAQTRTDSSCGKSDASKKRQCHFYKRKRYTTIFLIEFFPKNGGKRFALAWALWAHPHFLEKYFVEKNICVPFAFVKNGTGAF